jgi:hypothetical protein
LAESNSQPEPETGILGELPDDDEEEPDVVTEEERDALVTLPAEPDELPPGADPYTP